MTETPFVNGPAQRRSYLLFVLLHLPPWQWLSEIPWERSNGLEKFKGVLHAVLVSPWILFQHSQNHLGETLGRAQSLLACGSRAEKEGPKFYCVPNTVTTFRSPNKPVRLLPLKMLSIHRSEATYQSSHCLKKKIKEILFTKVNILWVDMYFFLSLYN